MAAKADMPQMNNYMNELNHQFEFPAMSPDGSLEDIRDFQAPSAALSSLGAGFAMENGHLENSLTSDDSQYEMVDVTSEASQDDHDTASIVSADLVSNIDGEIEDLNAAFDDMDETIGNFYTTTLRREAFHFEPTEMDSPRMAIETSDDDAWTDDDDDTPQQSMAVQDPKGGGKSYLAALPSMRAIFTRDAARFFLFNVLIVILVQVLLSTSVSLHDKMNDISAQRQVFEAKVMNMTVDVEKFLPQPSAISVPHHRFTKFNWSHPAQQQVVKPNHLLFSLPRSSGILNVYPKLKTIHVQKGDRQLNFNYTKLTEGVYDITIERRDAQGIIDVVAVTNQPGVNETMRFHFGSFHFAFPKRAPSNVRKGVSVEAPPKKTYNYRPAAQSTRFPVLRKEAGKFKDRIVLANKNAKTIKKKALERVGLAPTWKGRSQALKEHSSMVFCLIMKDYAGCRKIFQRSVPNTDSDSPKTGST